MCEDTEYKQAWEQFKDLISRIEKLENRKEAIESLTGSDAFVSMRSEMTIQLEEAEGQNPDLEFMADV